MRLGSGPEIMNESPGFDALFLAFQEAVAGQYSLQRELGRGGMAVVYLARDLRLDRSVAIKLLPPELAAHAKLRDRFMREARTAARLSHPYIVPIHAVDEVAGFVFYVMAYVDGETLAREAQAREGRSAQHPGERPVASLLPLDRERRLRRRDHRFPLGGSVAKKLAPIHPGEVLLADFLEPLQLSQYRLAHSISVPPRRINEIVHGKRAITADTALRLARFFETSEQFWLNLQARHDLEVERDRLGARLKAEVEVFAAAG